MVRTVTLSKCIIIIIVWRELPGNVVYSDGQNLGSVASYQCDNGLQQIQCETSGWSGALCGETVK